MASSSSSLVDSGLQQALCLPILEVDSQPWEPVPSEPINCKASDTDAYPNGIPAEALPITVNVAALQRALKPTPEMPRSGQKRPRANGSSEVKDRSKVSGKKIKLESDGLNGVKQEVDKESGSLADTLAGRILVQSSVSFQIELQDAHIDADALEGSLGEVELRESDSKSAQAATDGILTPKLSLWTVADQDEKAVPERSRDAHESVLFSALPLYNTSADDFGPKLKPWQITAGDWLSAAIRLDQSQMVDVRTVARMSCTASASVSLLTIDVVVFIRSGNRSEKWGSLSRAATASRLRDFASLMRFASAASDLAAEEHRRQGLDASAIYANLNPARLPDHSNLQHPGLAPTMFPFQRRTTAFLLGREGKSLNESGQVVDLEGGIMTSAGPSEIGLWWERIQPDLYFNCMTASFSCSAAETRTDDVCGALLAEEMGLGKTVEVLALCLHNQAPDDRSMQAAYYNATSEVEVQPVKASLIVTPDVLLSQWLGETSKHAPDLKAYHFVGHVQAMKDVPRSSTWHEFAKQYDIIVVSFNTLQKELGVAQKEPPRSRRAPRKYERPRCPLLQLEFFRVVCDEIQMVGNTSHAAEVASMIPRASSLAVSGTPVRRLADLANTFRFLRMDAAVSSAVYEQTKPSVWAPHLFKALSILCARHLKSGVQDEMVLPRQTRLVAPIDFTAVETAYYDDLWSNALRSIGMGPEGAPLREDWYLDTVKMRQQLLTLRQACTHPQVAARSLGSGILAQGNLRSLAEVLIYMKEQVSSELFKSRTRWASKVIDRIVYELQEKEEGVEESRKTSRARLEGLMDTLRSWRTEASEEIEEARRVGPGYSFTDAEAIEQSRRPSPASDESEDEVAITPEQSARRAHFGTVSNRRRLYTEAFARASHWLGNVCYQLGELTADGIAKDAMKDAESKAYDLAEEARTELLTDTRKQVEIGATATKKALLTKPLAELILPDDDFKDNGGIQSTRLFEQIACRLQLLNENAGVLFKWREEAIKILFKPVNREVSEENPEDDQYAESLDMQGQLETILEMYRPLLACRQRIVTYEVALGATDVSQQMKDLESMVNIGKLRKRRAHLLGGGNGEGGDDELDVLDELDREKLKRFRLLKKEMQAVSLTTIEGEQDSLIDLLSKLRSLDDRAGSRTEAFIAQQGAVALRSIVREETKVIESMRKELDSFARLFNWRAEYFKQLQALSDDLVDLQVKESEKESTMQQLTIDIDSSSLKIQQSEARRRYLEHLRKMESESVGQEARTCIICTDEIKVGIFLSRCGHVVCQKCFHSWRLHNKNCPICRQPFGDASQQQRIIYVRPEEDDTEDNPAQELDSGLSTKRAARKMRFNVIDQSLFRRIEQTTSLGRFGSKLDMLVKHLIYIADGEARDREGADTNSKKTIVFSAFSRGLELIADALRQNGLSFVNVTTGGKATAERVRRFTHGPINILLLHSEQTSAGLNLMATKHVILMEPLVNSGAERQALGRVHRIGQTKETYVYCYYVRDSVEERILWLAAHRGQSLYLKGSSTTGTGRRTKDGGGADGTNDLDSGAVIAANTGTSREKGDYINSTDDLLSCFFAEHTVGVERDANQASTNGASNTSPSNSAGATASASSRMTDAEHARAARLENIRRRELAQAASTNGSGGRP